MAPLCTCYKEENDGHAYVPWIYETFHDCVYTPTDVMAFFFGYGTWAARMHALCLAIVP